MRANLGRRIAILEGIAKQQVVSWVDFVLWLDEHEDEGDVEVELCPELQELVETMNTEVY